MRVQTWMVSDTKGRFAFPHLPAGNYTLSSYALNVKHTLKVGTTPVHADLRAAR